MQIYPLLECFKIPSLTSHQSVFEKLNHFLSVDGPISILCGWLRCSCDHNRKLLLVYINGGRNVVLHCGHFSQS